MSALAMVYSVTLTAFFILFVNATLDHPHRSACVSKSLGAKPLVKVPGIPGRYNLEVCHDAKTEEGTIHIVYHGDLNPCNVTREPETLKLHSFIEKEFEVIRFCRVGCENITFDLIANGCYSIISLLFDPLAPWSLQSYKESSWFQYIKDSQSLQYFNSMEPTVKIQYDFSYYINILWNTGHIPVTRFSLKVCPRRNYNAYSKFEDCTPIDYCRQRGSYLVVCSRERPERFNIDGPKVLVFQHTDVPWEVEILRGLSVAIFDIGNKYDTNTADVINGTAHYLDSNQTDIKMTTMRTKMTSKSISTSTHRIYTTSPVVKITTTLNPNENQEHRSKISENGSHSTDGGRGAIIACVVIGVLVLAVALVVRTLHVRGRLRHYVDPSFRFTNPLNRYNENEGSLIEP